MTRRLHLTSLVCLMALALAAACAPRPLPTPLAIPAPPPRDTVVLVPDDEDGSVGRLQITAGAATVELTHANEATFAASGHAPSAPTIMPEDEVQRLFGAAVSAQPEAPRHFNLYFELGGDTLTAESNAMVAEVIATVKARPAPEVSAAGHTDTTGAADANVQLALRRAEVIRNLLVAAGLERGLIEVISYGESSPLVATPDNTAEPRNRRVEVAIR
jgi:outer membrane protein OmpA-like peptidoglycan-associated protein